MENTTYNGIRIDKVKAAQRAVAASQSDSDITWLSLDHPNEEKALNRLLDDLEEPERWDGMS